MSRRINRDKPLRGKLLRPDGKVKRDKNGLCDYCPYCTCTDKEISEAKLNANRKVRVVE